MYSRHMVNAAILFAVAGTVTLAQEPAKPTAPTVTAPTKMKRICRPAIETGSIISRPRCHTVPDKDGSSTEKNGDEEQSSAAPTAAPTLQFDMGVMGTAQNQ